MNRKQRRENGDMSRPKTYTLTDVQIKQIKLSEAEEASRKAFIAMLGLPLIVLRDDYGFGKKRLEEFTEALMKQYKCFEKDYITLEELKKIIFDETGMKVME